MKLHNKRLASLWDFEQYSPKRDKPDNPIDGKFILSSLFSVSAYASKKDETIQTKFAGSDA